MEDVKGTIEIIRDSLIISGFLLGIAKVAITWKSFWGSNDISRRKVALEAMQKWTTSLTKKSSLARKIVESLDSEQCRALKNEEEFKISDLQEKRLTLYFDDVNNKLKTESGLVTIDAGNSSVLRWEIITYLNSLENVLVTWRHNISDRDIIEEQFSYLYSEVDNHNVVDTFRTAIGVSSYPSINEFIQSLKEEKENSKKKGKKKI